MTVAYRISRVRQSATRLTSLCVFALFLFDCTVGAQVFLPRGILPGDSYHSSTDGEEINLLYRNLVYRLPIYKFPAGPGGQSFELDLVYNSLIYDHSTAFVRYEKGGWGYNIRYSIETESQTCVNSST